jgi:GTP pyrophosphokinase
MAADGRPFDEVYDLMGLRVIAPDAAVCYRALDVVHAYYTPVAGRYKDYIARPKANFYQSIHTTVRRPDGALVEVQIRTPEMDAVAEYGVAAHWRYRAGDAERKWGEHPALDLLRAGLRGLGPAPARARLEALFADLVHEDVFIFTPRGEVKRLPRGATPVDFSYAVHTAVGHRCTGAKVNGKLAPLRTVLETGDVVEVLTGAMAAPRRDWLEFVVSAGARHKIRAFLRRRDRAGLAARGRTLLRREAAKLGLNARRAVSEEAVAELARGRNLPSGEELLVRVGEGALAPAAVAAAWAPTPARAPVPSPLGPPDYSASVRVAGVSRLEVKLARCCAPAPAAPVIGYVTSRGAVTVHRAACPVVNRFRGAARLVEAAWRLEEEAARGAVIRFDLPDGGAPLAAAVRGVRRAGLRLAGVAVEKTGAGVRCTLQVSMATRPRLEQAASRLRAMPGVARLELTAFG